jgi:Domain of unknown function (DUF4333)
VVVRRMNWVALAPAVMVLGLAGCSFSASVGSVDTQKAQTEIAKGIQEQTGATGVQVKCPDDVPLQQGGTFTCTATASNGESATVSVTQTDDQGGISWKLQPSASESPSP